jgi:type I restriction enzyme S subunit
MRVVPLPVAPLNEQKRIVAKIEALQHRADAAKAALDAIPPLLEKFRQSVLAAAFRGDLTQAWRAQNPDAEPATALLERIRAERRARWIEAAAEKARARAGAKATKAGKPWPDDANAQVLERERAKAAKTYKAPEPVDTEGLPDLPAGWCWARWEEVGLCQNGRAFPSKHYCAEGTKLLRPGNLHVSGDVRWTDKNTRHMPDEWVVQYPSFVIGANELVMNLTAQSLKDEFLGRVCLTSDGERCLLNQRIARLTPIVLTPRFCLWLFKGQVFRRYVENGLNTGSLIQHMFTSQVYDFVFPLPPEEEHEQIVDAVEALLNFKRGVEDGVVEMDTRLPGLNQSILAKAFRGELVPQDPTDEPASVLLERIRAERAAAEAAKPKKTRRRRAPAKGHPSTVTEESE